MKISLNRHDLHTAIREYLRTRNISTDNTEMDISIKAVKGGQPSADISILDGMTATPVTPTVDTSEIEKAKPLFAATGSE